MDAGIQRQGACRKILDPLVQRLEVGAKGHIRADRAAVRERHCKISGVEGSRLGACGIGGGGLSKRAEGQVLHTDSDDLTGAERLPQDLLGLVTATTTRLRP